MWYCYTFLGCMLQWIIMCVVLLYISWMYATMDYCVCSVWYCYTFLGCMLQWIIVCVVWYCYTFLGCMLQWIIVCSVVLLYISWMYATMDYYCVVWCGMSFPNFNAEIEIIMAPPPDFECVLLTF